jgi:dissimilatory sulfite reductase (desulfoviridin) alpha/beta subunit
MEDNDESPNIDTALCLKCGKCIHLCPRGTLVAGKTGLRVMLGGKLGRHPRLAEEIEGIYTEDEVIDILKTCLDIFKKNYEDGKRFADILQTVGKDIMAH